MMLACEKSRLDRVHAGADKFEAQAVGVILSAAKALIVWNVEVNPFADLHFLFLDCNID